MIFRSRYNQNPLFALLTPIYTRSSYRHPGVDCGVHYFVYRHYFERNVLCVLGQHMATDIAKIPAMENW